MAFFGRRPQPEAPVVTAPPAEPKPVEKPVIPATKIGKGVTFIGDFKTDEEIRIEGAVQGDILSTDTVTIRENGAYVGNAGMRNLEILGSAEGSIVCEKSASIRSTGKLKGALQTETLLTEDGAIFDGRLKLSGHPNAESERNAAEAPAAPSAEDMEEGDNA